MFSRSGSTSSGEFGRPPRDAVLWIVRDGHVLASCVQARELGSRLFPTRVDMASSGAVILYGRLPVLGMGATHRLVAIHLDGASRAMKISRLVGLKPSIPTLKTKLMIVMSEELVSRFNVSEGDQFELKY